MNTMLSSRLSNTVFGLGLFVALILTPLVAVGQTNSTGVVSADISGELTESGQLQVTEIIRYDLGPQQTTGFARRLAVPTGGDITINSVQREGLEEEYRTTRAGRSIRIVTGDPKIQISGEQQYRFKYTIDGVVESSDAGTQAVWPVVQASAQSAEDIVISFRAPADIDSAFCQIGQQSGCPVERISADTVRATIEEFPARQPVTLRADIPADVAPQNTSSNSSSNSTWYIILGALGTIAAISFGAYYLIAGNKRASMSEQTPTPDRIDSLE
jgi:hypothetical protein